MLQVCGYLGVIWDDAEELKQLAELSHPRVTIDTAGLSPNATLLANRLALKIKTLDDQTILQIIKELQ